MPSRPSLPRLAAALSIPAVALAVSVQAASTPTLAPPVAPPIAPSRNEVADLAISTADQAAVRAAALTVAGRVGLAGTPGAPVRALDPVTGRLTDTVEFRAADGRLAAVVARDPAGRLVEIVDLAPAPPPGRALVDAAAAPATARRLVGAAGLAAPVTVPDTSWDAGMDAWCVRWTRLIDGVPAPTDGLVAWVHRGGTLKALSDLETPLAPAPTPWRAVTAAAASAAAQAYAHAAGLDRLPGGVAYEVPREAWVQPDGFVDPTAADGTALHLAWVVRFSYVPRGWADRHVVELDVDAGTGRLIGGTETA